MFVTNMNGKAAVRAEDSSHVSSIRTKLLPFLTKILHIRDKRQNLLCKMHFLRHVLLTKVQMEYFSTFRG